MPNFFLAGHSNFLETCHHDVARYPVETGLDRAKLALSSLLVFSLGANRLSFIFLRQTREWYQLLHLAKRISLILKLFISLICMQL